MILAMYSACLKTLCQLCDCRATVISMRNILRPRCNCFGGLIASKILNVEPGILIMIIIINMIINNDNHY